MKATLHGNGPTFEVGLPPSVAESLALEDPGAHERLEQIFADALGGRDPAVARESLALARIAQERATPPQAWSRFMAKIGLACGREAYGDPWLDSRQAETLSHDLLAMEMPRFAQRLHHPPVERSWPYEPPKHQIWIEPHQDTAVLMVALFGQLLGAVPINDLPADADPSAWSLDPRARTFYRSTFPAIWLANAARRIQEVGGTPYVVAHDEHPFVYTPDSADGLVPLRVLAPLAIAGVLHPSRLRVAVGPARVRRPGERIEPTPDNIAVGLYTVRRFTVRGPGSRLETQLTANRGTRGGGLPAGPRPEAFGGGAVRGPVVTSDELVLDFGD